MTDWLAHLSETAVTWIMLTACLIALTAGLFVAVLLG
jgi:hypothetical protein